MNQKNRIQAPNKRAYALLLTGMLVLFLSGTRRGFAQEPTPTLDTTETATTETQVTPAESPTVFVTETAAPAKEDAQVAQVLVKITPNAHVSRVQPRLNPYGRVIELEELNKLGVILLEIPAAQIEEKMRELHELTGVAFVEPNYSVQAADVIPNDPGWGLQPGLNAIRAPQGWGLSTGSGNVTVAIVDSGVDMSHADLAGKITGGYDFVNDDNTPQDDFGHGTHVAGIAAAQGNNGTGIAGVSWGAKVMPLKVLNSTGGGTYANVAAAIVWAADHGAQIINLSLGGASPSVTLEAAVVYAYNKGLLVVAASGNNGGNQVLYPARYPQVMAVGATNFSNQPASFSNYGPEVDVAAPGENIYSLAPGGYLTKSGTSMSSAHVSGLAAVLFSFTNNAGVVRNTIEATTLDVGPAGWDLYSGAGLIQMDSAIALLLPPTPTAFVDDRSKTGANSSGLILPTVSLTPSLTSTPLASRTPTIAPPSQTSTPLIISPSPAPTQTPTATSVPSRRSEQWQVLLSPYPCGALALILAGLFLWRFSQRQTKL
ncbi:MAG: peptidase S8 [Chloroflexi bacterium]|nr:peptidase S8 [Chloroflexota bacterium]